MEATLPIGRVTLAIRFAAMDHLVGIDLRLDHADSYSMIVGVPFMSIKITVRRGA